MDTASLAAYLLAPMVAWVNPADHDSFATRTETLAHYTAIANDVAEVTAEEEPVFDGDLARERTALLLVSIASIESSFNAATDEGRSVRKGDNDSGRAVGLWQTHWRWNPYHWSREDIAADRKKAIKLALLRVRQSFAACRGFKDEDKLTVYATGQACRPTKVSEYRVNRALDWYKEHPFFSTP